MLRDEIVQSVLDSYPIITEQECCSFAVMSDDLSRFDTTLNYVCHAPLRHLPSNIYDQLVTSYPVKDQELDLKFFDFMKNVLYKQWAPFIFLERTEAGLYYIRLGPLSQIPANIVYNFCICSRAIVERRDLVEVWDKLVTQGLHPSFAFAVCKAANENYKSITDLDEVVQFVDSAIEHWPFYLSVSLKSLMVDGPKNLSANFKSSPQSCIPTNTIWGETQDLRALGGKTIREFWEKWEKIL